MRNSIHMTENEVIYTHAYVHADIPNTNTCACLARIPTFLHSSAQRLSLSFVILGHVTFNVGQRRENTRVDVFLGPRTHSVRQVNAPYMFFVTCGNVTSPITQTHRCYPYMHYLFRFTNACACTNEVKLHIQCNTKAPINKMRTAI
jgi:hypothetical protein